MKSETPENSEVSVEDRMATMSLSRISIKQMADAHEKFVQVDQDIKLHVRVWGHIQKPKVLLIHDGPGTRYFDTQEDVEKFFPPHEYNVIEVDQRGTGKSRPSVLDDSQNQKYYFEVSIDQMASDFEAVRKDLGIENWLIFGGGWGSTLGLYYASKYPEHCLGLIVHEVLLLTDEELGTVYAQKTYENTSNAEKFSSFLSVPKKCVPDLDPNNPRQLLETYKDLVDCGNREAIWNYFVFRSNLAAEDGEKLLDPLVVDETLFREAQCKAFFEPRLYLKGVWEEPIDLLGRLSNLRSVPTWVVQGEEDLFTPPKFTKLLIKALEDENVPLRAYFVTGNNVRSKKLDVQLMECIEEFSEKLQTDRLSSPVPPIMESPGSSKKKLQAS